MNIEFKVDDKATLETLKALGEDAVMRAWASAILEFAKQSAREKIGGQFGARIARFIDVEPGAGETQIIRISPDTPESYIGEHVHLGGPIRSRKGKKLAIPLPDNPKPGKWASEYGKKELFRLRSKRGNELLFKRPGKDGKLAAPLFVLKDETKPQAPRPWWPTQAETEEKTKLYFEENF